MYKLALAKTINNYKIFEKLKLFDKSIVTKGMAAGIRKAEILRAETFKRTSAS